MEIKLIEVNWEPYYKQLRKLGASEDYVEMLREHQTMRDLCAFMRHSIIALVVVGNCKGFDFGDEKAKAYMTLQLEQACGLSSCYLLLEAMVNECNEYYQWADLSIECNGEFPDLPLLAEIAKSLIKGTDRIKELKQLIIDFDLVIDFRRPKFKLVNEGV